MSKGFGVFVFLLGLALGIAGTILLPSHLQPYLPESLRSSETIVRGTVMAKQRKGNTLLLTVSTSEGAILATFEQKVDEVNLLIAPGDEIEFALEKYAPFVTDPRLQRVVMGERETVTGREGEPSNHPAQEASPTTTDSGKVSGGGQPATIPTDSAGQEAK